MNLIVPDWPAPANVLAAITTRSGGASVSPWNSLNLAFHVGDDAATVEKNWQSLSEYLTLPVVPRPLNQVHGIAVVEAGYGNQIITADGSYTRNTGQVCAVLTADCLPILLCHQTGIEIAAFHAGWRGLAAGIVAQAITRLSSPPAHIMAYLGPAISQQHFEVGPEVKQQFLANAPFSADRDQTERCFIKSEYRDQKQHWMADLYELARIALRAEGVSQIYGGDFCTYADAERFYSYRREGQTGRMASLICVN